MGLTQRYHFIFSGIIAVALFTGCSNRDDHNHPDLKTGEALYLHHCAECHGKDGTGMLEAQTPANILTQLSRAGIVNYITLAGNTNRQMPVFSTMPNAEAVAIAGHVLKLRRVYQSTPNNEKKPRALMIEP